MQTFKTKAFKRFADKSGLSDAALCRAVEDAGRGLLAADLGGGVINSGSRVQARASPEDFEH